MGLLFYSIAVIKADVTLESVKTGEVREHRRCSVIYRVNR